MSTADRRPAETRPDPASDCVALLVGDGDVVIYDATVETAWIRSDAPISIDAMA